MNKGSNVFLAVCAIFIEWVEFSIFVYLNTIISKNFFPQQNPEIGAYLTLGIFAISYFVRPFGAIIYGYIADKRGRKKVMVLSVLLMSLSTLAIGMLPDYSDIGIFAPILMLVFRVIQGFAIAVEFNNSGNFLIEHLKGNRILASSFIVSAATGGMCTGALIVSIMDFEAYPWIWRVPFVVASIISFLLFILRKKLNETPEFLEIVRSNAYSKNPLQEVVSFYKARLFMIATFAAFIGVMLYGGHVYFASTYLVKVGGLTLSQASRIAFYTEFGLALTVPAMAIIGQTFKCYNYMAKLGIILMAIVGPLLFYYGETASIDKTPLVICLILYVISDAMFSSSIFYYIYALLPVNIRCTGSGLAYSTTTAIFGGTTPLLAEFFVNHGYKYATGFYISVIALITYRVFSAADKLVKSEDIMAQESTK
jgi:MHS family proline/betaine transporter-like MFS transporter